MEICPGDLGMCHASKHNWVSCVLGLFSWKCMSQGHGSPNWVCVFGWVAASKSDSLLSAFRMWTIAGACCSLSCMCLASKTSTLTRWCLSSACCKGSTAPSSSSSSPMGPCTIQWGVMGRPLLTTSPLLWWSRPAYWSWCLYRWGIPANIFRN